ncbi:DsrE/DsrF/DrsH-like family protein [Alicyclobacillus tolerans]|uniref:DsrE/DsrF/DrsH-like family protein n=1 Tax=Alicyclobacillus tolerans TaxID=90970 RepID=UPI001F3CB882|nr:DsrE/DsrF/DrsH-like family protein [Alicyclobacillus tolerans]MCF8563636.1 DsrE/DsrF/DrsH-like family protein [Alicyclobacillus tolerans]
MGRKVAIIASQGTLDTAYKVLNIATAAAAMDADVTIFFTFEGLMILTQPESLQMAPGKEQIQTAFGQAGLPSVKEMLDMAAESGVKLLGCQMSMDVMGIEKQHLFGSCEVGGAAAFLDYAFDADVTVTF